MRGGRYKGGCIAPHSSPAAFCTMVPSPEGWMANLHIGNSDNNNREGTGGRGAGTKGRQGTKGGTTGGTGREHSRLAAGQQSKNPCGGRQVRQGHLRSCGKNCKQWRGQRGLRLALAGQTPKPSGGWRDSGAGPKAHPSVPRPRRRQERYRGGAQLAALPCRSGKKGGTHGGGGRGKGQ